MRLLIILLASFSISACSTIPESWKLPADLGSWKFDVDFWNSEKESLPTESVKDAGLTASEPVKNLESVKQIAIELDANQVAKVQVGQTKDEVLEILGPAANVDHGVTLADHYVKGGEVYDVLYFRMKVNGVDDIRALLFKANQLIGIGWSEVN
ncbi:MAG: hypothetical protein ACPH10_01715 [Litorivicinaceae bacterium]